MKRGQEIPKAAPRSARVSGWQRLAAWKIGGCALSLIALLALVSCGGGTDDTVATGGIGGTGTISIGPISGLGSIFVNDIEFDTSGAEIEIDGASGAEEMLQVGMVVTVEGTLNEGGATGVATSVVYDDNVQGPISAIDSVAGSLTVLRQHVLVDGETVFDTETPGSGLAGLDLNDAIEVSGLPMADGSIQATRISRRPAGEEVQVSGPVNNVTGATFQLNDLVVDYSQVPAGMPRRRDLQNGDVVEARGRLDGGNVLIAAELRMKEGMMEEMRQMQVAGYIQAAAADSFTLGVPMGTLTVIVGNDTLFTGGTSADLGPGARVAVQGSMAMGTMTAQQITILQ